MNYNFTIRGAAGGTPPHSHEDLIKLATRVDRPSLPKKPKSGIQTTDRQRRDSDKKTKSGIQSTDRQCRDSEKKTKSGIQTTDRQRRDSDKKTKSGIQSTDRQRRDSEKKTKSGIQTTARQRRDSDKNKVTHLPCVPWTQQALPRAPKGPSGSPTNTGNAIRVAATSATITIWFSQSCYVQGGVHSILYIYTCNA